MTGRIPELNEEIRFRNLNFTVVKKSPRRLRQVKVNLAAPAVNEQNGVEDSDGGLQS